MTKCRYCSFSFEQQCRIAARFADQTVTMNQLSTWIARRYLIARRSLQFISVITILSLVGIAVGVAAIICVSSIFNGFREVYQSSMMAYDPHLRVLPEQGAWLQRSPELLEQLRSTPHVKAAQAVVSGRAVVSVHNTFQVVQLHGVHEDEFQAVSGVAASLVVGSFKSDSSATLPSIVIGAEFANTALLQVDDTLSLMSPNFIENALQSLMAPQGVRCVVSGIFYTNSKEYNSSFAYCNTDVAQRLFSAQPNQCSSLDIRLDDPEYADELAAKLRSSLGERYRIETWYDLHKDLYSVMRFERFASFIILSVIVMVSVFNIFAMLTMTIVKKRADIGIMMSMGAPPSLIKKIFLHEGLMIGIIGTVLGLIIGLGLCEAQIHFKLIGFDPQSFIVSAIPVQIAWLDVTAICVLTILFSFLATIVPARRAAATRITEALRSE